MYNKVSKKLLCLTSQIQQLILHQLLYFKVRAFVKRAFEKMFFNYIIQLRGQGVVKKDDERCQK
jgi:hypothetical protein